ncbi:Dicer-like protein 1 [Entomophthora muscae]|uniref:Dicer-like protein 1 n=1 Tax=Entomophthora muscae TaxID=34485 RepID=A0ACC2U682_9FUNG|nr:Dicer-like protein 1 [Entomophthora muscae]
MRTNPSKTAKKAAKGKKRARLIKREENALVIGHGLPRKGGHLPNKDLILSQLLSELVRAARNGSGGKAGRRIFVFIASDEASGSKAFAIFKRKTNSVTHLSSITIDNSLTYAKLKSTKCQVNIFVVTPKAFSMALTHGILVLKTISAIFVNRNLLERLKLILADLKPINHSLPRIFLTPGTLVSSQKCHVVSLKIKSNLSLHSSSLDTLAVSKRNAYVSNMQRDGMVLQMELGVWAAEHCFSHALNRLANKIHENPLPSKGMPLCLSHLEPCLIAANRVSGSRPERNAMSISPRVEALLDLLTSHSSKDIFQGVVLTSCPLTAIYLEKVLGCFYHAHNAATEVAVVRPEAYTGPLLSIDDAFSRYHNGDVQVLVTTLECAPQILGLAASQLVFFDFTPSLVEFLELRIPGSPTTAYILAEIKASQSIEALERKIGDFLPSFESYYPEILAPTLPYVDTVYGARLISSAACYLINKVCRQISLSSQVKYQILKSDLGFQARLTLPPTIASKAESSGFHATPQAAKEEAAYKACVALITRGKLDRNLFLNVITPPRKKKDKDLSSNQIPEPWRKSSNVGGLYLTAVESYSATTEIFAIGTWAPMPKELVPIQLPEGYPTATFIPSDKIVEMSDSQIEHLAAYTIRICSLAMQREFQCPTESMPFFFAAHAELPPIGGV